MDLSERQHERVQRSLRLIAAREAYATAREHVLARSNQNRPQAAYELNKAEAVPAFAEVAEAFATLFDSKVELDESGDHDSVDAAHSAELLSAILIVLAGILGFGIAFYVATSIV